MRKVVLVGLVLGLCGCTVNLSSRHVESSLDDLTTRIARLEAAQQQDLANFGLIQAFMNRALSKPPAAPQTPAPEPTKRKD